MIKLTKRLFDTLDTLARAVKPEPSPLELGKVWEMYEEVPPRRDGSCPHCFSTAGFYEGPSGGMSTNVECATCGTRWNANAVGMSWQYIGRNDDLRAIARRIRKQHGLEFEKA